MSYRTFRLLALVAALGIGTCAALLADEPAPPAAEPAEPSPPAAPEPAPPVPPSAPADEATPPATPAPPAPPTAEPAPPATDSVPAPAPPGETLVNSQPAFLANVAVDRPDGHYRAGDRLTLRFSVERDAHVYLLYHQADDTTLLLFPNQARPSNQFCWLRNPGRFSTRRRCSATTPSRSACAEVTRIG